MRPHIGYEVSVDSYGQNPRDIIRYWSPQVSNYTRGQGTASHDDQQDRNRADQIT